MNLWWATAKAVSGEDDSTARFLCDLADAAVDRWREPDQGIWEARGKPQHYVSSKLMCWVALDRACSLSNRVVVAGSMFLIGPLRGILR